MHFVYRVVIQCFLISQSLQYTSTSVEEPEPGAVPFYRESMPEPVKTLTNGSQEPEIWPFLEGAGKRN